MGNECRLDAVHRLLDPGLLLGLEQRVVLERILVLVPLDRHARIERRVALLQIEVIPDHLSEQRGGLYLHMAFLQIGDVP